jgi:hypothetical protein
MNDLILILIYDFTLQLSKLSRLTYVKFDQPFIILITDIRGYNYTLFLIEAKDKIVLNFRSKSPQKYPFVVQLYSILYNKKGFTI